MEEEQTVLAKVEAHSVSAVEASDTMPVIVEAKGKEKGKEETKEWGREHGTKEKGHSSHGFHMGKDITQLERKAARVIRRVQKVEGRKHQIGIVKHHKKMELHWWVHLRHVRFLHHSLIVKIQPISKDHF